MKGCRVLEHNEIKKILTGINIRERALFLTCLTFGTRISEALALKFADVTGIYLHLKSSKGSENQSFSIPESYRAVIEQLRSEYLSKGINVSEQTPLFLSQKGKNRPITRQLASYTIRRIADTLHLGGKVNTHSLRKTMVTKIYELTQFNIVETLSYSRHKNLSNLQYYIRTTGKTDLVEKLAWA